MAVDGTLTMHVAVPGGSYPYGISAGSDGAVWFVGQSPSVVGRVDGSGTVQTKPLASATANPTHITSGPDGALWFTESVTKAIGRIPAVSPLAPPDESRTTISGPNAIATGSDGNLWFTEYSASMIGRMTPAGVTTLFPADPATANPEGITAGPDGALWYTEGNPQSVVRIATDGTQTRYPAPSGVSPGEITAGPDGALWFAAGDSVVRMTTDGSFQRFDLAAGTGVNTVTTGPDGNMWFTEENLGRIGRITTPPIASTTAATVTGPSSATVTGTANGHAQATSFHVDYGPVGAATASTPEQALGPTAKNTPVMARLANLMPATAYQARVVVTNPTGTTAGAFLTFTTASPAPSPPSHPVLGHVRQSARRWREGTSLAQLSRRRRPPIGTTFSFTLSQSARVTFTFTRITSGRKVLGQCRAPTRANRPRRSCKREVRAGILSVPGHAGADRLRFAGRLNRHGRLTPGRYAVRIVATNAAGLSSSPAFLGFTILRR